MLDRHLPLWLKLLFSLWMVIWVPAYWIYNGPANFLWVCDVANFVILVGLWLESPLLLSSQAVSVLLVQLMWALDFVGRLLTGRHWIGGTEYMFDTAQPIFARSLSLFHLVIPVLLLWTVYRLGYHRRGWRLQTSICWVILPASFFLVDPEKNLNWLWQPFGKPQTLFSPEVFLLVCMLAYPLVLYLPTHGLLSRWMRRRGGGLLPPG